MRTILLATLAIFISGCLSPSVTVTDENESPIGAMVEVRSGALDTCTINVDQLATYVAKYGANTRFRLIGCRKVWLKSETQVVTIASNLPTGGGGCLVNLSKPVPCSPTKGCTLELPTAVRDWIKDKDNELKILAYHEWKARTGWKHPVER